MRCTLIVVMAFVCVAGAQQPWRNPPPPGIDISARDGDRIIVDDDARIQIVRRRQATIRTIFSGQERVLIVLVDYSKPGAFPDGFVDRAFNFYQVDGTWPLSERWEALTAMYEYQGDSLRPRGFALETPQGLVQLVQGRQPAPTAVPPALAVLSYGGSSNGPRRGLSFAEAEKVQLDDFARSKASGSTVSTLMGPDGRMGTAVITAGVRAPNSASQDIPDVAPNYPAAWPRPAASTPPPAGQEIPASDGDRVIVEDDARVQIVRRRHATIRTIFNHEQRALIVLADYVKPGEFPDGVVDSTFNFYELVGDWPLEPRWEALTTKFQYEGDLQFPTGYALGTPQGLVHLSPGRPGLQKPEPTAIAVLWFRGSSIGQGRSSSFAEAEKLQLDEVARRAKRP